MKSLAKPDNFMRKQLEKTGAEVPLACNGS